MKRELCFFVIFLLVVASFAATKEGSKKTLTKEQKAEKAKENWKIINRYISINDVKSINSEQEFMQNVVRSPRNYSMLILVNTDRECVVCREVDEMFRNLAKTYKEETQSKEPEKQLFFLRLSIEKAYSAAIKMQVTTVPLVFYAPEITGIGFPMKPEQYHYYTAQPDGISEYSLSNWIFEKSGVKVGRYYPPLPTNTILLYLGISVLILPMTYLFIFHFKKPYTWFYVCLVLYSLNMSGFVGNFVHNNPWTQYNMYTGEYTYISPAFGRQYRLEGIITSALLTLASLCLIGINFIVPKVRRGFRQRLVFWFLLLTAIISMSTWLEIYCIKNAMYPFKYFFEWSNLYSWGLATIHEWTGFQLATTV